MELPINMEGWSLIGHFGVDAGLCWIGDPCYIIHKKTDGSLGKDWAGFCNLLGTDYPTTKSFHGLGVCVSTGFGDGSYPVYARIINNRIHQIFIDFTGEFDGQGEYE
jgi:hypothetical protein